jgi:hypothetical protein
MGGSGALDFYPGGPGYEQMGFQQQSFGDLMSLPGDEGLAAYYKGAGQSSKRLAGKRAASRPLDALAELQQQNSQELFIPPGFTPKKGRVGSPMFPGLLSTGHPPLIMYPADALRLGDPDYYTGEGGIVSGALAASMLGAGTGAADFMAIFGGAGEPQGHQAPCIPC